MASPDVEPPRARLLDPSATPSPTDPSTPQELGPAPSLSQITLPSTEIPGSPIDPNQSFRTEPIDPTDTVVPSSLTPPPSSQVAAHNACSQLRRNPSQSQPCVLFSPPATVLAPMRDRESTAYMPPTPSQILDGTPEELRAMLQTCVAENQKLKMETAHHRLQYNLLSMQAEEDSKRAAVEHDMVRREVDALRVAEHSRQARRELSASSDSSHAKYLQMKTWYEDVVQQNEALQRRLKAAKRVIHQKEEETIGLSEERDVLLTRIRENREHFHMLCSPGGIFHNALTPNMRHQRLLPQHANRLSRRDDRTPVHGTQEHGLSALIQAMSAQDHHQGSPSTPPSRRSAHRYSSKHSRNAQSMSSLPTTPVNRRNESGLLPSAEIVAPHTEPRHRHIHDHFVPKSPTPERGRRHKSRESTISVEDTEELARQAVAQSIASQALQSAQVDRDRTREQETDNEQDVYDSQASQAAAEMLRRHPGQRYDSVRLVGPRDRTPGPAEKSARMQARLLGEPRAHSAGSYSADKRKYEGGASAEESGQHEQGSPAKKMRVGGPLLENPRVGLGIQYSQ
ncbi:hypothetical protein HIM_05115 [Hirsutella minnesotensis 3608]|uniref:FAD-dependent oxidoreductase-like enzyme n=1 Tax=Hirsutella minnesotensis 3608 TaxID=1043627 RepID=A0A0F8A5J1_9HYPO|nr:hypothetical protein HIM_05115 [Hirsutella minnesotensis 3608]